jgi:hypothetical protein
MNIKYLSVITSLTGIIILYTLSLYTQIPIVPLSEIQNYEGQTITTNGTVIEYHTTSYGNQLITIQQDNNTIVLFLESPIEISNGDIIKATGLVQQYQDEWELIIDTPEHITIERIWENNTLDLSEIAKQPSNYLYQNLNVTGFIDIIYDEYFQFIDETHQYQCIVEKPFIKNLTIYTGQHIYLNAYFSYDETQMRYIFEFRDENHTIIPYKETT